MRKFFFSILLAAAVLLGEEYKAEPGAAPPAVSEGKVLIHAL